MKRKDEEEKNEESHQRRVMQMIRNVEGSAGLLHQITKPTVWRGGAQILEKEEEDARLIKRCEAKREEWEEHWQCGEEVQNLKDKPWKNEELKKQEEALPRLKEFVLERASRLFKVKTRVGCEGFHPKIL